MPLQNVKTCQVKGYVFIKLINIYKRGQSPLDRNLHRLHFFYIFVLDICSKPILKTCPERQKIARGCYKCKKLLKSCRTIWRCPVGTKGSVNEKSHFTTVSLIAELHAHEAGEAEHHG